MTRDEHLTWCKSRALDYLNRGDLNDAVASMMSDLGKHEDFQKPVYASLNLLGIMSAAQGDVEGVRRWITGFN